MRVAIAGVVACICVGCGSTAPDDGPVRVDTDVPVDQGGEGGSDVVETRLPGQDGVTVVVLCKPSDDGCRDAGESCNRYGNECDFAGERGVCGACCNGAQGELRCFPID